MLNVMAMARAYGEPLFTAVIRREPEDFQVIEDLGFTPADAGEHVFLWVEKRRANTEWVARQLARFANVPPRDIGFAGVKDRHAITQQWFSVWLKNQAEPDWQTIGCEDFTVLQSRRHQRKLKRGVLKGNAFTIILRDVNANPDALAARLTLLRHGIPNYFAEQRFGLQADNINKAKAWFSGDYQPKKTERGWLLSAARAYLFNAVLSLRIQQSNWLSAFSDDLIMLDGSHSLFAAASETDKALATRLAKGDIHITRPLYGKSNTTHANGDMALLEQQVFTEYADICKGLEQHGLQMQRRALRVMPLYLQHKWLDKQSLQLSFWLPAGCYATAVLYELLKTTFDNF